MIPKFFVGEKVRVKHPYQGTWIGYVLKSMFYRTNYKRGRMLIWAYNLHRLYKREDNRDYLIMQQWVRKLVSNARMVKLVDTTDLKSVGCNGRAGSIPAPSTINVGDEVQVVRSIPCCGNLGKSYGVIFQVTSIIKAGGVCSHCGAEGTSLRVLGWESPVTLSRLIRIKGENYVR